MQLTKYFSPYYTSLTYLSFATSYCLSMAYLMNKDAYAPRHSINKLILASYAGFFTYVLVTTGRDVLTY